MEPMSTRVVVDAQEIEHDIVGRFGISPGDLEGVGRSMLRAFLQVTSLHPKGFEGTNAWGEGSAAIRSALIPKGWHPEDPQNQPRIVSRKLNIAITVSSGSPYTGVKDRTPQTRNNKGAQTSASVNFNAKQFEMFPVAQHVAALPMLQNGQALWILLYYIDLDNRELRYELSQPTAMSELDKVSEWSVRYIFPPIGFGDHVDEVGGRDDQDDMPDIDIEVTPKK